MPNIQRTTRKTISFYLMAFSLLLMTLLVTACGSNANSGSGNTGGTGSTGSTPVSVAPTAVKGYGTAQGCPSDLVVSAAPPTANVVVKQPSANTAATARVGDVIEVRLPFGHKWSGPNKVQSNLSLQQPAGYAWKSDNVCIWRFVAKSTGTTTLNFTSQALCKAGQMCPFYIVQIPLTINVK